MSVLRQDVRAGQKGRVAPEDVFGGMPESSEEREQQALSQKDPDYWLGRYDVVKAWRKEHPGYQREWRRKRKERRVTFSPGEIQAEMFSKALDAVQKNVLVLREIQAEIPFLGFDIPGCLAASSCRSA